MLANPFLAVGSYGLTAKDGSCVFQAVTWVGCTSWWAAISATVFSPRIASNATGALNDAQWFRLGFLIDFPPVSRPGAEVHLCPCLKKRSHL